MSCEVINKIGTGDCELEKKSRSEQNLATAVASELVSEILEDALNIVVEIEDQKSVKVVGDILENLSNKFQELAISEEKMKMEDKIEAIICTTPLKGLGDQLEADEGISEETPIKHQTVEKKSRLTDLVKNSKQILAKLMLSENTKETSFDSGPERVLRVVELDSGDRPSKLKEYISPETVPLPQSDSCEILAELTKEDSMDDIQLASSSDKSTQKGDDYKKTMTFPMAGTSGKGLSLASRYRTLKFPCELKKKKWNFGTKIINYIRKHQSKKEGKQKAVRGGIEIKPKTDDE
nr:uncharacterized protein LOC111511835 [Leptinotarsa decemlineata]